MAKDHGPEGKASNGSKVPPRFAGQRVFFAGKIDWKDEAGATVVAEGGKVLSKLDPTATLLVAGEGSRAAEKQVAAWSKSKKGSTRVLAERAFLAFLAPTREEALVLLRQGKAGVARWNRLVLSDYPALDTLVVVDLSGASLAGAELAGAELSGSRVIVAKLDRADLSGADLTGANLGDGMKKANLSRARLDKANVGELVDCSLESATLRGASLCNGMRRCDFSRADLRGIEGAYMEWTGVILRDANLAGADLEDTEFKGADLRGADLGKAKATEAKLRKANLAGAKLVGADLGGADLSGADLSNADCSGAVLTTVNLTGAKIDGARFDGAKLAGTKLPGASVGSKTAAATKGGIGPHLRRLESVARQAQRLKSSAKVRLADGRLELELSVDAHGWVGLRAARFEGSAVAEEMEANENQHAVARGVAKLAARFADRSPHIESVTATSHRSAVAGAELKALVTRAWAEALGIDAQP